MTRNPNQTPLGHVADSIWLAGWLLVTGFVSLLAPLVQIWVTRLSLPYTLLIAVSNGVLIYGIQAALLPHPLRGQRGLWLVYGLVGSLAGTLALYPLISPLFDLLPAFLPMRATVTYLLAQMMVPALLHWMLLRKHTSNAWLWLVATFCGVLLVVPLNWLGLLVRWLLPWTLAVRVYVIFLMRLAPNIAAGLALWWLFHTVRETDRIQS